MGANYWKLLAANAFGNIGDGIALIALPWYASTLTGDAFVIAAVGVASRLPWLLFALIAGPVGDRVDRRRLMATAVGAKATVLFAFSILVLTDAAGVTVVLLTALVIGLCEVFFDNTGQAVLPAVVPRDRLERANGTMWGVEEVSNRFIGAPVAGLLIAVALSLPFAVQALLAAAAMTMILALRGAFRPTPSHGDGDARPSFVEMLLEGMRWLWRHRLLRSLAIVLGLFNGAIAIATAVLVLFVREVLDLGSTGFGLVMTAGAAGGIVSSQVSPWLATRVPPGWTVNGILGLQVFLYALIVAVPTTPIFVLAAVVLGFNVVWWNVLTVSLRQRIIPDRSMSRVNSVYRALGWGITPLGIAAGGGIVELGELFTGQELALRMPYLVAAVLCAGLLVFSMRNLSTRHIRAALAAAESR